MKLEDLKLGAIIMRADRKDNPVYAGEMWLVTRFFNTKAKFEAVCLHSLNLYRIGETGIILFNELHEYELITAFCIQPSIDNPFLQHKPSKPKKDLWLRWCIGNKTTLGKVGEPTPYSDEKGNLLCIGDAVKVKRGFREFSDCLVVWDEKDDYYIMGIGSDCDSRTASTGDWELFKERSYTDLKNGDKHNKSSVEVVDFPPEAEDN